MTAEVTLAVVIVLIGVVWLALARANRIDLLHQKVTRTGATLDAQLLRRAGLAAELATSGELDPASALVLAEAAATCLAEADQADLEAERTAVGTPHTPGRATLTPEREAVESELTAVLREGIDREDAGPLARDVLAAAHRVALARRFYNDAVAQVVRIRTKSTVRLLRLAGNARMPRMFEMDDAIEPGPGGPG